MRSIKLLSSGVTNGFEEWAAVLGAGVGACADGV